MHIGVQYLDFAVWPDVSGLDFAFAACFDINCFRSVIVELENFVSKEIIDGYDSVTVSAEADDPTTCVVEFSFAVAHGLNRIYLTAHITV